MSNRKILYDLAVEKKFNDTKKKLETRYQTMISIVIFLMPHQN